MRPHRLYSQQLVFTVDQQLYKFAVDILSNSCLCFEKVTPLGGGMHTLMTFNHAVCIILSIPSEAILTGTFGKSIRIMSGKKYLLNFRALRMHAEEMLRNVMDQNPESTGMDMLFRFLDEQSKRNKTSKLWNKKICAYHDSLCSRVTLTGIPPSAGICGGPVNLLHCRWMP